MPEMQNYMGWFLFNTDKGGRLEDYLLWGKDKREAVNAEETGKEDFSLLVNPHHMESKGQAV
jgi:hypothetical protein